MNIRNLKGNLILILAALIWGLAFVAQDRAAELIGPFTLNGIRSLIGSAFLVPVIFILSKRSGRPILEKTKLDRKHLLTAGILCGVFLCVAVNFQQFGIALYPEEAAASGRSGFITALYVILVPLCGFLFRKRVALTVWLGVGLTVIGMYLLCFSGGMEGIYLGDIIVLCCAFAFTFQILCIDRFADRVDGVKLSAIQFFVCGVLSLILMFIFEQPELPNILAAWFEILYLGIFSSGIAYTLQIIGQQYSQNPTVASILMSLESVFALIGGAILLGEQFSIREIFGCVLIFAAIILAQLPSEKFFRRKAKNA